MNTSDAQWNIKVRETAQQFSAAKGRAEAAMARVVQFAAQRGVLSAELARVRAEIARRGGSSFSARAKTAPARPPAHFAGEPSLEGARQLIGEHGKRNLFCFSDGSGPVRFTG